MKRLGFILIFGGLLLMAQRVYSAVVVPPLGAIKRMHDDQMRRSEEERKIERDTKGE